MDIFLTGATGFIGSHLVRRLVAEGHSVRCLVRRNSNTRPLEALRVRLVYGDVNDRAALREGMRGCDWLFHLANLYSMWEPDPARFARVNIDGTRLVLETALETAVKKVVYISTVAVFGKPAQDLFNEESSAGLRLFSEYARTKSAANDIAWDLHHRHGLPLVVLYPGIVLGAGDEKASGQYIQDIIRRRVPSTIFHDSCVTYVYVGDLVESMLRAAQKTETIGQKYLIGGQALDGKSYADQIHEISAVPLPLIHLPDWIVLAAAYLLTGAARIIRRPPLWGLSIDAGRTLKNGFTFDGSKAVRELGIHYTPIRKALEEAIAFYQESRAIRNPRTDPKFARP